MSKLKKVLLMCTAYVLVAALAIGGTIAYLQDDDSDVNVMTLGNVSIAQHEYERVVDADGSYATKTIDDVTSYVLQDFTQGKALLPIVGDPSEPGGSAHAGYDTTVVRMTQVGSYGGMDVFAGKNAQDKFVVVENTGKTDAYVRTLVAIEVGTTEDNGALVKSSYHFTWTENYIGTFTLDNNEFKLYEYIYNGWNDGGRHVNGILPAGDTAYPSLSQVYLKHNATNEYCEALDGNGNGTLDILVLSQAVQAAGFENAQTALDTAFGTAKDNAATWFGGEALDIPTTVFTLAELRAAMAEGGEVILGADISVASDELLYKADGGHKDGSAFFVKDDTVIDLNGHDIIVNSANAWAEVFFMNFGADLTIMGEGDIKANCSIACVYDASSTLNIEGGNFYVTANNDMLYAIYGKINVSGGTFTTSYWNTINIYGSGRTQLVDVSGGSFKNWNPASSPDGNLLADGYKVVSEEIDGVTWYTVVAE